MVRVLNFLKDLMSVNFGEAGVTMGCGFRFPFTSRLLTVKPDSPSPRKDKNIGSRITQSGHAAVFISKREQLTKIWWKQPFKDNIYYIVILTILYSHSDYICVPQYFNYFANMKFINLLIFGFSQKFANSFM